MVNFSRAWAVNSSLAPKGYYAPGITPMLAISAAYAIMGVVGHGLMRLIAGPATNDPLTQWRWKQT